MIKNSVFLLLITLIIVSACMQSNKNNKLPQVETVNGILEGINDSGILTFKGIPYAAPPTGNLRWKEPQPMTNWEGARKANNFGPRPMQLSVFGDMNFRSDGMSEDCLYLNVWAPLKVSNKKLPVLVYFYGGGYIAGDGSEPRYDGESMARKGIVSVTVNYRLGLFGFMAHPELTKESPHNASGNYGLLDQAAALKWINQNIAAFGGDPNRVTIAGESAGSLSVISQMVSPLSKNLIAGAIGESGSFLRRHEPIPFAEAEKRGLEFTKVAGVKSIKEMREISATKLLDLTTNRAVGSFKYTVDGYFFPQKPEVIYESGRQANVPLLVGWNSQESSLRYLMGQEELTRENFINAVQNTYKENASEILKLYNPSSDKEVEKVATDLASDNFNGFCTWKWADLHAKTVGSPVYRYYYSRPRPAIRAEMGNVVAGLAGGVIKDSTVQKAPLAFGAVHSAEIEYALGNLPSNRVFDWQPEDFKVSEIMQAYFANFIKTGNPNGIGLPVWSTVKGGQPSPFMHINVNTREEIEQNRDRFLLFDKLSEN